MCSAAAQCRERRRFFCERGGVLDGDVGASVFLGRLASRRLSDAHFSSLLASFESCFLCLGAAGAASLVVTVGLLELARDRFLLDYLRSEAHMRRAEAELCAAALHMHPRDVPASACSTLTCSPTWWACVYCACCLGCN